MPPVVLQVPGLSLEDRYSFCMAPVPRGSIMVDTAFMEFACMYARGQPVTVDDALMPSGPPRSEGQMAYMEDLYKVGAWRPSGAWWAWGAWGTRWGHGEHGGRHPDQGHPVAPLHVLCYKAALF